MIDNIPNSFASAPLRLGVVLKDSVICRTLECCHVLAARYILAWSAAAGAQHCTLLHGEHVRVCAPGVYTSLSLRWWQRIALCMVAGAGSKTSVPATAAGADYCSTMVSLFSSFTIGSVVKSKLSPRVAVVVLARGSVGLMACEYGSRFRQILAFGG